MEVSKFWHLWVCTFNSIPYIIVITHVTMFIKLYINEALFNLYKFGYRNAIKIAVSARETKIRGGVKC